MNPIQNQSSRLEGQQWKSCEIIENMKKGESEPSPISYDVSTISLNVICPSLVSTNQNSSVLGMTKFLIPHLPIKSDKGESEVFDSVMNALESKNTQKKFLKKLNGLDFTVALNELRLDVNLVHMQDSAKLPWELTQLKDRFFMNFAHHGQEYGSFLNQKLANKEIRKLKNKMTMARDKTKRYLFKTIIIKFAVLLKYCSTNQLFLKACLCDHPRFVFIKNFIAQGLWILVNRIEKNEEQKRTIFADV